MHFKIARNFFALVTEDIANSFGQSGALHLFNPLSTRVEI